MAKKKYKAKNEFRYSKKTKHPVYIFEEHGKKYNGVGITHKAKTFGRNNMPLHDNPQKDKNGKRLKEKAYIRNGIISDNKKSFVNKPRSDFEFSKDDFVNVKAKIRHYKKERKKRKQAGKAAFYTVSFVIVVALILFFIVRGF